ncbi:hypothetical protein DFS34DRAFT_697213 [Phlyctochytrium arcticum]|nr:hypothetical protein DFS34DRAFT_697213 [Phlyctochytrium arcticum]
MPRAPFLQHTMSGMTGALMLTKRPNFRALIVNRLSFQTVHFPDIHHCNQPVDFPDIHHCNQPVGWTWFLWFLSRHSIPSHRALFCPTSIPINISQVSRFPDFAIDRHAELEFIGTLQIYGSLSISPKGLKPCKFSDVLARYVCWIWMAVADMLLTGKDIKLDQEESPFWIWVHDIDLGAIVKIGDCFDPPSGSLSTSRSGSSALAACSLFMSSTCWK